MGRSRRPNRPQPCSQVRVWCFLGTRIVRIVSAVMAASAAVATTALVESIQTTHAVDVLLANTTQEMIQQTRIDQEILNRLSAIESAVRWLGKQQDALVTCQQLSCGPGLSELCVTPLQWNSSCTHGRRSDIACEGPFPLISGDKSINSSLGYINSSRTRNDLLNRRSFRPCMTTYNGSIQKHTKFVCLGHGGYEMPPDHCSLLCLKVYICWEPPCLVSGAVTLPTGKKAPRLEDLGTISH
ncbi:hypothetical protein HJG60_008675 [Phyllostomus discolor]|uniref:Retroviral envelope protein GP41-like domain-containing protein n=1 Tax=Phyllostomus discolor TaxID=89673 RepID=A0A833Z1G5_9CHIR|nr:hypothetical protein HJG60_008675 [Phyllostomus discolor]